MKNCSTCKIEKPFTEFGNHKSRPDGLRGQCKGCEKQYRQKHYQLNSIALRQQTKQRYIDNPDKAKLYQKKYRLNNPDKISDYNKQYRLDNVDKIRQYSKEYHHNNIEVANQSSKQWRIDNAEYYKECKHKYRQSEYGKLVGKAHLHKRRALIRENTTGKHWTPQDIILKLKLQHGKCVYCQVSIRDCYEIDHFKPISKGGGNEAWNIQLLCKDCNRGVDGKWTNDAIEFAKKYGKLV